MLCSVIVALPGILLYYLSQQITKQTKWHAYPANTQISLGIHMKNAWVLSYPLSAQQRLWSVWADAQADLSLCWAHMPFCCFYMRWFIFLHLRTYLILTVPNRYKGMSHNNPHNVHEDEWHDQMAVDRVSKATKASENKKRTFKDETTNRGRRTSEILIITNKQRNKKKKKKKRKWKRNVPYWHYLGLSRIAFFVTC